jgi:hypothetical protein
VRTHTARGWESERVESRAVAASWAPAAPRASRPAPGRHWHCATRRTSRYPASPARAGARRPPRCALHTHETSPVGAEWECTGELRDPDRPCRVPHGFRLLYLATTAV